MVAELARPTATPPTPTVTALPNTSVNDAFSVRKEDPREPYYQPKFWWPPLLFIALSTTILVIVMTITCRVHHLPYPYNDKYGKEIQAIIEKHRERSKKVREKYNKTGIQSNSQKSHVSCLRWKISVFKFLKGSFLFLQNNRI